MTTRAGVGPLIATVVSAAATFLAAGLVIQFALGGSQAAQEELRGGVQIDDERAMYQLIMYDSLIAYQCDPSAGGNLDGTGDNDWASWKTYKRAAQASPSGGSNDFTFQDLNESFRGDELGCYGTETSIGGQGIYEAVHPSSREWRNDQEGEHSRIRWSINETDEAVALKECIWFDQSKNLEGNLPAVSAENPSKGWGQGGITDMLFYITNNAEVNSHDYYVHSSHLHQDADCREIEFNLEGGGSLNQLHGNFLTVSVICDDSSSGQCSNAEYTNTHSSSTPGYPADDFEYANRIRGPDSWSTRSGNFQVKGYKLCPGARGYIQTNTGWTWGGNSDEPAYSAKDYMETPDYFVGRLPGESDREKYSNQDDDQDNSVHPIIVIEDAGDTSNCPMP